MVVADSCRYTNEEDERIADSASCGELSVSRMDTLHRSKRHAYCQRTDDHDRHVEIKSTIRMLTSLSVRSLRP
jgi:hypothetical protein